MLWQLGPPLPESEDNLTIGSAYTEPSTGCVYVWDGSGWVQMSLDADTYTKVGPTDEELEERYPELKALKEQYNELKEKCMTFEIIRGSHDSN